MEHFMSTSSKRIWKTSDKSEAPLKNKMKPTNPNAHTYVEDNDVKVSIMIGDENVNAQTYRKTVEQRHCSGSAFSPRQQHWRRNAVARGK